MFFSDLQGSVLDVHLVLEEGVSNSRHHSTFLHIASMLSLTTAKSPGCLGQAQKPLEMRL